MSRYTTFATGFFVPEAQRGRTVIVVDTRRTESAEIADEFIRIKRGGDYEVLSALRAIVRGKGEVLPREVAGVSREQLIRIAEICKKAKFGAIFFGLGLTMSAGKYKNVRNAIELTDELNRHTKFTISPLRGHANVYGSNEVFTWITGYPYAVDFARGIAFYNPGETTAVDILRRGECDAALDRRKRSRRPFPPFSRCPSRKNSHDPDRPAPDRNDPALPAPDPLHYGRDRCGRNGLPHGRRTNPLQKNYRVVISRRRGSPAAHP